MVKETRKVGGEVKDPEYVRGRADFYGDILFRANWQTCQPKRIGGLGAPSAIGGNEDCPESSGAGEFTSALASSKLSE